ncbi:peptide/nickel transport system permease protein [Azospirillum lipoferum]|uniref:ABC transporter permease n=1 Tax=Azospirillum lipoferum TaxID=193 RepID=A0A5A9GBW2_AZOLI|nr:MULTISPECIES: ABC transporter permease [Azospirillum]KAA0591998.1 ABC transporter permease [Azospirillum lipoferum]MCP1612129.1 peptide/nickel transport system permease protein [Azospirillum lipoferum]MDW5536644.1 ABC transporter permease [Azospirillum sp. NL1]
MLAFLLRRLVSLIVTVWLASIVVFAVLQLVPGDPALLMLGVNAQPDTLAALRSQMGLDQPILTRYLHWAGGLARGDFGVSLTYARPVADLVAERLAVTLPLSLLSLVISTVLALPLGLLAAARRGRGGDWAVLGFSQLGVSMPSFWIAILLILLFSLTLHWFPAGGFPGWSGGIGPALHALLLPALALAVPEAAILARVTRTAVLDTLAEDHIRTARAKGVGRVAVLLRHALPNALIPVATVLGLQISFLVAGAVVVENVFTLPGLGRLLYQAIGQRDLIVVQGVVVLLALFVVLVNALVDIACALADPRPPAAGKGGES